MRRQLRRRRKKLGEKQENYKRTATNNTSQKSHRLFSISFKFENFVESFRYGSHCSHRHFQINLFFQQIRDKRESTKKIKTKIQFIFTCFVSIVFLLLQSNCSVVVCSHPMNEYVLSQQCVLSHLAVSCNRRLFCCH